MRPAQRERFARWQKITIDHLGFCNNLILALAMAALSYSLNLAQNTTFVATQGVHCSLGTILFIALVGLSLSIVSGLLCMLNRLCDFRGTAQRVKDSPDAPSREELEQMGKRTWVLFYGQALTFLAALVCLGTAVWFTFAVGLIS